MARGGGVGGAAEVLGPGQQPDSRSDREPCKHRGQVKEMQPGRSHLEGLEPLP